MDEARLMKELRQMRNVLILIALKSGATTEEVGTITGIGRTNISGLLPQRPRGKKATKSKG